MPYSPHVYHSSRSLAQQPGWLGQAEGAQAAPRIAPGGSEGEAREAGVGNGGAVWAHKSRRHADKERRGQTGRSRSPATAGGPHGARRWPVAHLAQRRDLVLELLAPFDEREQVAHADEVRAQPEELRVRRR